MSKAYTNDFERCKKADFIVHKLTHWSIDDVNDLQKAFSDKGYNVTPLSRVFCFKNETGSTVAYRMDALVIPRWDSYIIEEYLSTQRVDFYRQAEGRGDIALIFTNQTSAEEILKGLKYLPRGDF